MALSYHMLYQHLIELTSVESVVGYLNKHDGEFDHLRMEEKVLSKFKGRLLEEIKLISDFQQTWFDLNNLIRSSLTLPLNKAEYEILKDYCNSADYSEWCGYHQKSSKSIGFIDIGDFGSDGGFEVRHPLERSGKAKAYNTLWEDERGVKSIVLMIWEDIRIGAFSHVWDVISGQVEVHECLSPLKYCRNLFVRDQVAIASKRDKKKYCNPLCRQADAMRKSRRRNNKKLESELQPSAMF